MSTEYPQASELHYDYTALTRRTDPAHPAIAADQHDKTPQTAAPLAAQLPTIAAIWARHTPDPATLTQMTSVLVGFLAWLPTSGRSGGQPTAWHQITDADARGFIAAGDPSPDTRRLRKNTLHGAFLALRDAGLYRHTPPTTGIDPVPDHTRNDNRGRYDRSVGAAASKTRNTYRGQTHVRTASGDEVLLIRLAARLASSTRATHLAAAAVAICSATATTGEAPQVLWAHVHLGQPAIQLPGRAMRDGQQEQSIASRRNPLNAWSAAALADWHQEKSTNQLVQDLGSVLYGGTKALTDNSAGVCVDQAVRKALESADLRREPGLSAGSLRLWGAARNVTDRASLYRGAAVAGIAPGTLHREIHQLGERRIIAD